jgi:phosphopantetheinyl transferase (holo-ACP synthase)
MTDRSLMESFIETISISEVEAHLSDMLAECFHPSEQSAWQHKPAQSIAGRIALKAAMCALAKKHFPGLCLAQKDIIIEAASDGAPRIARIFSEDEASAALLKSEVFVSISHSRTKAAGMACIATRDIFPNV